MKRIKVIIIILALICIHQSCTTEPIVTEDNCDVSYKDDLVPLIVSSCANYCHAEPNINHFATYENFKEVLDNGALKEKLIDTQEMPPYPLTITEEQRALFACWIEAGGPNN